jgi:hypothetical protein
MDVMSLVTGRADGKMPGSDRNKEGLRPPCSYHSSRDSQRGHDVVVFRQFCFVFSIVELRRRLSAELRASGFAAKQFCTH